MHAYMYIKNNNLINNLIIIIIAITTTTTTTIIIIIIINWLVGSYIMVTDCTAIVRCHNGRN